MRPIANKGGVRGFSLVEVMIAVLVLAVGLLALVALQTTLVREGADAKARSRIATLLVSRMDQARASGYFGLASVGATTCSGGVPVDICDAQSEAAVSSLTVTQDCTKTRPGVAGAPACTDPSAGANDAQYKTVTLSASWTDAAGTSRRLAISSIISPLSLDTSSTLLNQSLAGDTAKKPIVRTDNPATAGVVPIALGNGSSSAASNPTPELVGQGQNQVVVATRFDVLTYIPQSGAAQIQKRIETQVVKCNCSYGAGGNNLGEIYRKAQWPAIWTGEKYEVYTTSSAAPGVAANAGPKSNATQSALCTECCRDHHDTAASGVPKFDPEGSNTSRYVRNGQNELVVQSNTSSGNYYAACRMVRVDGLWRTASDMYLRNLGLLETTSVANVQAKSGVPTTAAQSRYGDFVKSYLRQYDGSTSAGPTNAQTLFNAVSGLNDPASINISAPSTSDFRYLHARGLYVDYLEAKARAKLANVLADTASGGACPSGTAKEDCVMPYLPFTSANLTEIGRWLSGDNTTLVVNTSGTLATNPEQPSGGRAYAKKVGATTNTVSIRTSNSGIAVNTSAGFDGVDPSDESSTASDSQAFVIGGAGNPGTPSTGDDFYATITGGGVSPFLFYTIGNDTGECINESGKKRCGTNTTLPAGVTLVLSNYWTESTDKREPESAAGDGKCESSSGRVAIKGQVDVPEFTDYRVSGATVGGVAGTVQNPATNPGKASETTTITFGSVPADATVSIALTAESPKQYAKATTCLVGNGGQTTITGWSYPWK